MRRFTIKEFQGMIKRLPEEAQQDPDTILLIDDVDRPDHAWVVRVEDGAFLQHFGVFSSFIKNASDALDEVVDYLEEALDDPRHPLYHLANASITLHLFDWEPELLEENPDMTPADILTAITEGKITSDHTMGVGNRGYWYCPHNWKIEKI